MLKITMKLFLDVHTLSCKNIRDIVEAKYPIKLLICNILPKNSNFIIGSNDAIGRGEVIVSN